MTFQFSLDNLLIKTVISFCFVIQSNRSMLTYLLVVLFHFSIYFFPGFGFYALLGSLEMNFPQKWEQLAAGELPKPTVIMGNFYLSPNYRGSQHKFYHIMRNRWCCEYHSIRKANIFMYPNFIQISQSTWKRSQTSLLTALVS